MRSKERPGAFTSGALGYFGVDGAMDLSMVIRSIIVDGDSLSYGVGGAIFGPVGPGDRIPGDHDKDGTAAGPHQPGFPDRIAGGLVIGDA